MERAIQDRRGVLRLIATAMLLAGVSVLVFGPRVDAGEKTHTKVTATATKPDAEGKQVVTVTLEIEKPWHVYANPTGNDTVEGARTKVSVSSKTKLQAAKIVYPPGKPYVLDGEKMLIYEKKVSILAQIQRAMGDTGPLEVLVEYMNCTDKVCMPGRVKLTVP